MFTRCDQRNLKRMTDRHVDLVAPSAGRADDECSIERRFSQHGELDAWSADTCAATPGVIAAVVKKYTPGYVNKTMGPTTKLPDKSILTSYC